MAAGRFSRTELLAFRGATVDDLLGHDIRLLFVGINPGLWTAAANAHFARPGNRFWPALHAAGITSAVVDASAGMPPWALDELDAAGIGISNIVQVATARADELTREELLAGGASLRAKVVALEPAWLAIVGVTAYRTAFGQPRAAVGAQDLCIGSTRVWVLPNPSGLNAHYTPDALADEFARLRAETI